MSAAAGAKEIIEKILYVTVATVDENGQPWNSPVYSAYDEDYNFYWASWKDNQRSKNIRANSKVFLVIYDSTVPEGTGEGVYIQALATELADPDEISRASELLAKRKNKDPRPAEQYLSEYPRRIYKAETVKAWMNGSDEIDGNYVDKLVEVQL
jgi:nitroimidazol reductase NimA-like FMN-containing flavoprotein (pyridoxamine 5'-phosphate oxidase superfamily)